MIQHRYPKKLRINNTNASMRYQLLLKLASSQAMDSSNTRRQRAATTKLELFKSYMQFVILDRMRIILRCIWIFARSNVTVFAIIDIDNTLKL